MQPMRRLLITVFFLILLQPVLSAAMNVPKEIGGFMIGEDIDNYPEVESSNYLKEVVITDWYGFKKGIISYGECAYPGKIVKIHLKYENSSKVFYKKLLSEFKNRFGPPMEWNGDAFGLLFKWKWRFVDENNESVNLTLQHNLKDHRENIGTIVKLYFPKREEEERLCFNEKCDLWKSNSEKEEIEKRKHMNWDYLIPK